MLRDRVLARLASAFGTPQPSAGADRWCLERKDCQPLRICLFRRGQPGPAQILILDPAQVEGDSVLGISIERDEQLSPMVERVRLLVAGRSARFIVRACRGPFGATMPAATRAGGAASLIGNN